MDSDDDDHINPYLPSTSRTPTIFAIPPDQPFPHFPQTTSSLSFEDEQAILRALADDDDAGFGASLENFDLTDDNPEIWDPFATPSPESNSLIPVNSKGPNASKEKKHRNGRDGSAENEKHKGMSLVDPQWEVIDPTPDIWSLFNQFNKEFFWGTLTSVEVKWSKQMMSCAGICRYQSRAGYCSIGLSFPLLRFRPRKDLVETLLDRESHGPFFHEHMFRINKQTGTNISVYHSFHDEVNHYKQHIWRCEGPCRNQRPYNGFVKRSSNRAPSKNDLWWASHEMKCGGVFVKVNEPEGFRARKKRKNPEEEPPKPLPANQPTLNDFKGFKSPVKRKDKPVKIDVNLLGDKLPRTPEKRQTTLNLPLSSGQSTLAFSPAPEIIDLTSPTRKSKLKDVKPAKPRPANAVQRQLQLNAFFPSLPTKPPKAQPFDMKSVLCIDL